MTPGSAFYLPARKIGPPGERVFPNERTCPMERDNFHGLDRREYFRILYAKMEKPVLAVGPHTFEILDLSNAGIRFINNQNVKLPEYITGELTFLSGETVHVAGILKWERSNMYGLYMQDRIPDDIIIRELENVKGR